MFELTCVIPDSSPADDNMWDARRVLPVMIVAVDRDMNPEFELPCISISLY